VAASSPNGCWPLPKAYATIPAARLYLVSRQVDHADIVWVTELWRSQAALDAAVERIRGSADVAETIALTDGWEMIELELLGGKRGGCEDG
jgi:hypothetical protein